MTGYLTRSEPQAGPQHPHEPALIRQAPDSAPLPQPIARILVSDDDPAIRRIYATLLPAHGMEIIEAPGGDGWATLELAQRVRPWLLLTDVNKPGLDGQRLRAALRTDRRTAHLPILTVSAIDLHAPEYGPLDDTLVKPFSFGLLLHRLTTMLPLTTAAHTRLVAYALTQPTIEDAHPITGLPGMHAVAAALPTITAEPGWAALSLTLADFRRQVRLRGRAGAEALLARMAGALRDVRTDLLIGHTGMDAQIVIIGPAPAVARATAHIHSGINGARALATRLAPNAPLPFFRIRHADTRHGSRLNVLELRRALR